MTKTNLEEIKNTAKCLFMAVPIKQTEDLPVCQHPFTNTPLVLVKNGNNTDFVDARTEEGFEKYKKQTFEIIDRADSIFGIIMLLNSAYYMTFLKFTWKFMSDKDFGETLRDCWTQQEWPNRDNNVTHRELVSWFKKADKNTLMSEEDNAKLSELKAKCLTDGLTLYRGVNQGGKPNGLSWTTDKEKAEWFANRWSNYGVNDGKVYMMYITDPSLILAYFSDRGENEVIVDTIKMKEWVELKNE